MLARLAADATLLAHAAFIAFAVLGALLAIRWRWIPWVQIPCAGWGLWVEAAGHSCPLTRLENHFRLLAGQGGYGESFIEHYLLDLIYPPGLTRELQFVLAGIVLGANAAIYGMLVLRRRRTPTRKPDSP